MNETAGSFASDPLAKPWHTHIAANVPSPLRKAPVALPGAAIEYSDEYYRYESKLDAEEGGGEEGVWDLGGEGSYTARCREEEEFYVEYNRREAGKREAASDCYYK